MSGRPDYKAPVELLRKEIHTAKPAPTSCSTCKHVLDPIAGTIFAGLTTGPHLFCSRRCRLTHEFQARRVR